MLLSDDLIDAIKRADVYRYFDWRSNTLYFVSMNEDSPLTDEEKRRIYNHVALYMFPFSIEFKN